MENLAFQILATKQPNSKWNLEDIGFYMEEIIKKLHV